MSKAKILVVVALAIVSAACKKTEQANKNGDLGSAAPAGSATVGSGSDMAGSGSAIGSGSAGDMGSAAAAGSAADGSAGSGDAAMAHHAGNCPSAVFGSITSAALKGKTVVVTIKSDDKDAIAAIQKRTDEMLKGHHDGKSGDAHDRQGSHGGKDGMCPIFIPEGGKATAKRDKTGVAVTITPVDKVDDLKAEIDQRIARVTDWVKANIQAGDKGNEGGVGGGKGRDGSNHSGKGDGKGQERKADQKKAGSGGGGAAGTGGGGGAGTGGGGSGTAK